MSSNRTGGRAAAAAAALLVCTAAAAQTPAPQPDVPSIKIGVVVFADYTIVQAPRLVDSDGNTVTLNAFQIGRSYINITGNISRTIAFRVTPDVVRETGTSSLNGSYTVRLKYAYAQWNLDGALTPGSYARFGMQPSPWIDMVDSVYRYRFQGPAFVDREGFLSPADAGATLRYVLPHDYGDVHGGVFNGESYQHAEVNDQKGFQIRGSLRPLPGRKTMRGFRVSVFHLHDAYVKNAERLRTIGALTFEHPHVHAGFDYLVASDRTSAARASTRARGWTAFATPISGRGWEGLFRRDHLVPDRSHPDQAKDRTIAGIAYWFPHHGTSAAALMVDVDRATYGPFTPARPDERRFALHSLISF